MLLPSSKSRLRAVASGVEGRTIEIEVKGKMNVWLGARGEYDWNREDGTFADVRAIMAVEDQFSPHSNDA